MGKFCRPQISLDETKSIIINHWGFDLEDAILSSLPSYDELNTFIRLNNGQKYVLKASRIHTPERLRLQHQMMSDCQEAGVPVPNIILTKKNQDFVVQSEKWPDCFIRIFSYLDGQVFEKIQPTSDLYNHLGETVGKISKALSPLQNKAAEWTWDWDLKKAAETTKKRIKFVKEKDKRQLISFFLNGLEKNVLPKIDSLPKQICHGDLNNTNLLVHNNKITGVLDFGDAIMSCRIFEIGIAIAYGLLGQDNPLPVAQQMITGYFSQITPAKNELEILYWIISGRLMVSVVMSAEGQFLEPENDYLTITAESGWNILRKLRNIDPNLFTKALTTLLREKNDKK